MRNNCEYHVFRRRCYIKAVRNIPAGSEILVSYGNEYWRAIRDNIREEEKEAAKANKKAAAGKKAKSARLPHQDNLKLRKKKK